jgi:putative metalloenzyme radical SAM/SPASM domain maturase
MAPAEGELSEAQFAALEAAFPHLESLVLNGIGEPLLHPLLESFVRRARDLMPPSGNIGFQTNGLLMDRARAEALVAAGLDRVCVSLDALDEKLYAGIRSGGELDRAIDALDALEAARSGLGRADFRIGIEFVARRDNLDELGRLVRWAAERGLDFMIVSQLFPYEKASVELAAYHPSLDLATRLRADYEARGAALGLDIKRYSGIYMKYEKTAEELAIVRLVGEMQEEAISRGITLNVDRLLGLDLAIVDRARIVFAEAEAIAHNAGIQIELPTVEPQSIRSCEFVEGGSAFVSWDGAVHPCYFLWHRYDCYVGGYEQHVAPRRFGSLADRGILDIWNDGAFAAFRANVLGYDYPFCLNCNLALCDYVQLEPFTQDCHINAEPCAACLWCMGLFRCMY